jgi:hypothetical protein
MIIDYVSYQDNNDKKKDESLLNIYTFICNHGIRWQRK